MAAETRLERAYVFADLSKYSLKDRLLIRGADAAFYFLIQLLGATARFEVEGWENWKAASRDGSLPIYSFWHNRIFLSTYFWRKRQIVVMTSQSLDGEYIARFIQRFGYGAARGSSTRGAIGAMIELVRLMRAGRATAFTVDGPKGPRYQAKLGPIMLAKKTGHPVLPFTVSAKSFWEIRATWDRTQIPKPFTRARVIIAPPIYVPADADENKLAATRDQLQAVLEDLDRRSDEWRAGISAE
jgi:lysophospholipid acyltransferase (LPLAT)-like uncharacterized protein